MKIYDYHGKRNVCGVKVKEARKRLKLSQEQLAAKMQLEEVILERDCISRIEIGTRFVADFELLVLAKILKVSPAYLLGLDD